jgi:uracil-DNA glycosylase
MPKVMLLVEGPLTERQGDYLKGLTGRAGVDFPVHQVDFANEKFKRELWDDIERGRPGVVVAMGALLTALLLKKHVGLKGLAGQYVAVDYMAAKVCPWYSVAHLLRRGKAEDERTVNFFKELACSPF